MNTPARPLGVSRRSLLAAMGLGLAAVPLLSACSAQGTGGSQSFSQPDGNVPDEYKDRQHVIFWAAFTGANGDALQALVDQFNQSQTDIYCEVQSFDGYDSLDTKLVASLQARQTPDLAVFSDVNWNRYFLNDSLEPLDDYFTSDFGRDTYQQRFLDEGTIGGKTWWVPFARSTPLFYYNREVFQAVGLPDRTPETYTEMREWAKQLKGFRYRASEIAFQGITAADDWYYSGQLWAFGGKISDGLDVQIDSEESLAAAQYQHDLIFTDKSCYYAEKNTDDFKGGVAATVMGSTGGLTGLMKSVDFPLGVGFLPKEVATGVPTGGSGIAILRNASADRKKAAFEVLKFLGGEEASANWAKSTGYMPATVAATNSQIITDLRTQNPNYGIAIDQLQYAQGPDPVRKYVSSAINDIRTGLQQMYTADTPVAEVWGPVADTLRQGADQIRDQYEQKVANA